MQSYPLVWRNQLSFCPQEKIKEKFQIDRRVNNKYKCFLFFVSTFNIIDMMVVCLNIKLLISHSVLQMCVSVIAYEVEKDLR